MTERDTGPYGHPPSRARCAGCHKLSDERPLGHTPPGWFRDNGSTGGRYWCEKCGPRHGRTARKGIADAL